MKKPHRVKKSRLMDRKIEQYCSDVAELLTKIHDKYGMKEMQKEPDLKEENNEILDGVSN